MYTKSDLAEFWMVEPEIAFADLLDTAHLAEKLLQFVCKAVLDERSDDMSFFEQHVQKDCIHRLEKIIMSEFVHMDYGEAITALQKAKKKFEFPVTWGVDLQSEHERYLVEKHFKKPVIITDYPKTIKAFYMKQNDDGKTVRALDVLFPQIGEIIGGSQREDRSEEHTSELQSH